jgi:septum formation protein
MTEKPARIVLASTSPFRKELLSRLGLPFETANPETDEAALPDESPEDTALRLSEAKRAPLLRSYPDALIIGSDQVASLDGRTYGKPGTHENAVQQLRTMRGRTVNFFTGLCLLERTNRESTCSRHANIGHLSRPDRRRHRELSAS